MNHEKILKYLDQERSYWEHLEKEANNLTVTDPQGPWNDMLQDQGAISSGKDRVSSARVRIEKATTSAAALRIAATAFEEARTAATTFASDWRFTRTRLLNKGHDQNPVDRIDKWIKELQDIVHNALNEIDQLLIRNREIGTAVANVAEEVQDASVSVTSAIKDATTYPVLTQEVSYSASPVSAPSTGSFTGLGPALGSTAMKAINDVLGWKSKPEDPKGFVGALNASFTCKDVEGHTEYTWTPRTYAVATDLAGGITGAQASIYTRAKEAVDLALPLLDGIYALDPAADEEDLEALKKVARDQMAELVRELGMMGGPRAWRVSQYFNLLLGVDFPMTQATPVEHNPDKIQGTFGRLRDLLGFDEDDDLVNSVEDEQDLTNFRILADYITSLAQSWVNDLKFFITPPQHGTRPFFGTQLVLLSRQLSVIAESVDEVRFAMDSVFIGPAERQTLELKIQDHFSMYAEDILSWVVSFATEEGPRLIEEGGKYAVGEAFASQARKLHELVTNAGKRLAGMSRPYSAGRVVTAWDQLANQLEHLEKLAKPIKHVMEPAIEKRMDEVLRKRGIRTA